MGTIREYGYREYPDDLTPGKGGESSLLFDSAGALTGHAPFHLAETDESEEPNDSDDEDLAAKALLTAAVVVGVGAACYGVAKLVPRVVAAIRARRRISTASDEINAAGQAEGALEESADLLAHDDDPQDALINEVKALCSQDQATTASAGGDSLATDDSDEEESSTRPRSIRKRPGTNR